MNFNRTQTVIVNSAATMPTANDTVNPTNLTSGEIAIVKNDNTVMTPGNTVSDSDVIRIVQGTSAGLKWSQAIPGKQITKVTGRSYAPATKKVVAIGYNRASITNTAAAGAVASIAVANSTLYEFSIVIKSDKQTFSERLGKRTLSFTSAASATQLNIAVQIANAINNSTDLNRYVYAVIVGDGGSASAVGTTSINGVTYTAFEGTGASNYGVEICSKTIANGTGAYKQEIVDFDVFLNDSTGFGSGATTTTLSLASQGVGTYQLVYNAENFAFSVDGTMNRTQFPINLPTAASSSTGVATAAITPTATSTAGRDELVMSATVAGMLSAGDKITVGSSTYTIKYFRTATSAIVEISVAVNTQYSNTVATHAAVAPTKTVFYDEININFSNASYNAGSATINDNNQAVLIAIPSIDAGGAYNSTGTVATGTLAALNPYINSLGFASISI